MDFDEMRRREVNKSFWRGFGQGLGRSLTSENSRARFKSSFRLASLSALVGSFAALSWAKHIHVGSASPLTTSDEIAVSITGAVGATAIAILCRWLWRRAK